MENKIYKSRQVSIKKVFVALKDHIIGELPGSYAILQNVEVIDMNQDKAPKWFVQFEKKNDERWDKQEKFNKTLMSLPTIKKELEELNK